MKTIIGEARYFSDGLDARTECGIVCECGYCVIIKKCDREVPVTNIQCPRCGHQTRLVYGELFD